MAELTARWPFTATQQHQLRGLLVRWHTLTGDPFCTDDVRALHRRDEVLAQLKQRLADVELILA